MLSRPHVTLDAMVDTLKAAAESSRLRILALLARGDLTVSDLTEILNQSQPRVSRHLKLLLEAGLIGRYQEGSWAFFRLSDNDVGARVRQRAGRRACMTATRRSSATSSGSAPSSASGRSGRPPTSRRNAASWDEIRALHATDGSVEAAIRRIVGKRPFQSMLDLGTGTGRLLELFAPLYRRGVGIDMSREMLTVARANLDRAGVSNAQVRQGDIYAPPVERDAFDLVTIHQVLHYLDDPQAAIREAARTLRPGGPAADRRLRLARAGVPARGACACAPRLLRQADRRMVRRGRPRPRGHASSSSRAPAPIRR